MDQIKEKICGRVDMLAETLFGVSEFLKDHPETAYQEYESSAYLGGLMKDNGFTVQESAGGVKTAFVAHPGDCAPTRPAVAILAEYDALPAIGHGCGHNLIAAASVGAALALEPVLGDAAGGLFLVGTPAEEGGGGKARMAAAGVFEPMDAAMMFHPGHLNLPGKGMLGRTKFTVEFFGRPAHASGSPDKGINALDAMVTAYVSINALRQHLRPAARIHGIITHGGDAPNIIPEHAAGLFYVRAGSRAYRDEVFEKVRKCAEGAALATGAACEITVEPPVLDPYRRNLALEAAAQANMEAIGIRVDEDDGRRGSSDIGNLSHVLPCIHPFLAIVDGDIPSHSEGFRDATTTARGKNTLIRAAKMLALTACDFLTSPELRKRVKQEFDSH
jgi:amidohydrolase